MRSCVFYSPNKSMVTQHDGMALSDRFDFDRPLASSSCVSPDMIAAVGGGPFTTCGYEREPVACPMYQPEEIHVLRRVRFNSSELELSWTRVKFGIVEYYITSSEGDTQEFLHRINAHEYGEDADTFARELFAHEVDSRGDFRELDIPVASVNSYLQEVVDEVRAAS